MKLSYLKYLIKISVLILCFVPSLNAQIADTIHVHTGWNMISLPLKVQDAHYLTIFPDAISKPFPYPYPYYFDDTLRIGKVYWIKFGATKSYIISGDPIHTLEIEVNLGWNMIGSISYPVFIKNIQFDEAEIMHSDYFKFNPASGYEKSDTIKPGVGYWVKVDRSCKLILISMGYPCPGIPTVEYEGKTYNTVQIGNQCWFKENLDVGMMILGSDTAKDNGIIEKYCYDDSIENCNTYGGLYQWNEAMQYTNAEGSQGICPTGWHIPKFAEFHTLSNTVGGDGNALKAVGQGTGDGVGTNSTGFSALLAGWRMYDSPFWMLGGHTFFWTSTEDSLIRLTYYLCLRYNKNDFYFNYFYWDAGFSVRCLKD